MNIAMHSAATSLYHTGYRALFCLLFLTLTACSLPLQSVRPDVYDFGPGKLATPPVQKMAPLTALGLAEIEASAALDSTAVLYRLAYDDTQKLQPYTLARWSMPPAQLVRQRLREHLEQLRPLLNTGDSTATPLTLRMELEEFSQLFEAPDQSVGLLHLRATLTGTRVSGEKLLAQRSIIVQRPAPSADAAGGVRALKAAADAAAQEIEQWLMELGV